MAKGNISTRSGDKGTTGVGGGGRVDKDDARIEAVGDLDETTSTIGVLRAALPKEHDWEDGLRRIQTELMNLMGHVATPSTAARRPRAPLPVESVIWMEDWMGSIEESLAGETDCFLLPGGNLISAQCHIVRTVARRAERRLVTLNKVDPVDPSILKFVNRLSDLMFKLARQEIQRKGLTEDRWQLFKSERESE